MRDVAAKALQKALPHLRRDPKMKATPGTIILVPDPNYVGGTPTPFNGATPLKARPNDGAEKIQNHENKTDNNSAAKKSEAKAAWMHPSEFLHLARRARTENDFARFTAAAKWRPTPPPEKKGVPSKGTPFQAEGKDSGKGGTLAGRGVPLGLLGERDKHGRDPLMLAAKQGNERTVRILLEAKADVKSFDVNHNTAIMHAAMSGFETICLLILRQGAPFAEPNSFGKYVSDFAEKSGLSALLAELAHRHEGGDGASPA
mmetsp:Transcript_2142/g.4274  ORF Transcript_2142/g.4274 Transcript_2142/m.4274 type:complete len:259 (-) Transcript_2142:205-981(-)